jgi:hypothetical protein
MLYRLFVAHQADTHLLVYSVKKEVISSGTVSQHFQIIKFSLAAA